MSRSLSPIPSSAGSAGSAVSAVSAVAPGHVELTRRLLAAGIPLTLLLDLAAGGRLDSRGILETEQVVALVLEELARAVALRETDKSPSRDADIA